MLHAQQGSEGNLSVSARQPQLLRSAFSGHRALTVVHCPLLPRQRTIEEGCLLEKESILGACKQPMPSMRCCLVSMCFQTRREARAVAAVRID